MTAILAMATLLVASFGSPPPGRAEVAVDPIGIGSGAQYGIVELGSSFTADIWLYNFGAEPVTITGVAISGVNAADFPLDSETCTATPVPAGGHCISTVTFRPLATGDRYATLTITGPPPVDTRTVELMGTGVKPASAVSWTSPATAGPELTWNTGRALARTVEAGTEYLHVGYATDRIGDEWATDVGPYAGVYHVRSDDGGTWSTPTRLNPATQHATKLSIAAADSGVYATWMSQADFVAYSPAAPRTVYVRASSSHGDPASWGAAVRLTSVRGRVDEPTIAAAGSDVYVAWTDSVTGAVKLATSHDRGAEWRTTRLGGTKRTDDGGSAGLAVVAADGSTVAIAWIADGYGTLKARVSTDRGATWGAASTIANGPYQRASIAVLGDRVAVAWTYNNEVIVRQNVGGVWQSPTVVEVGWPAVYGPALALQDGGRLGVAWTERLEWGLHGRLLWTESADGGASWFETQAIASELSPSGKMNEWPSIVWPAADKRWVLWNGSQPNIRTNRLYLSSGTGLP
jgi:hypothetical protein